MKKFFVKQTDTRTLPKLHERLFPHTNQNKHTHTHTHTQTQSHPNRFSLSLSLFRYVFVSCGLPSAAYLSHYTGLPSVVDSLSIGLPSVVDSRSIGLPSVVNRFSLDWSALSGPVDASSSVCACGTSLKHYRISGLSLKVLGCGLQGFEGPWEASGCVGACKVICWCESFLEITKCCGTWAPKGVRLYIHIYRVFKVWGRAFVDSGLSFLLRISALRVYTIGF